MSRLAGTAQLCAVRSLHRAMKANTYSGIKHAAWNQVAGNPSPLHLPPLLLVGLPALTCANHADAALQQPRERRRRARHRSQRLKEHCGREVTAPAMESI